MSLAEAAVTEQKYSRPPITEAVFEVRFESSIEPGLSEKVFRQFASAYPQEETLHNLGVHVNVNPANVQASHAQVQRDHVVYRRSSNDRSQLMLLVPNAFVVSQLAPYPGWETFFGRFQNDWERFKKVAGYQRIGRIGVRYLNRIDIPIPAGDVTIDPKDYLNIYVKTPEALGQQVAYAGQVLHALPELHGNLLLNTAIVPSPLFDHISIMLDLDVHREGGAPQLDKDIFALLTQIRTIKDDVFEHCITDAARSLFNR
jgi:uncharacterized protein (TIGR04255 family)